MTDALCLNCGAIKFGALCSCPKCKCGASDNREVNILFSDHRFSREVLEDFSKVIQLLGTVAMDPQVRVWAFLKYMSDNYPQILYIEPPSDHTQQVADVLRSVSLPRVEIDRRGPPKHHHSPSLRPPPTLNSSRNQARALNATEIAAVLRKHRQMDVSPAPKKDPTKRQTKGQKCPNCGMNWPESVNFCGRCGTKL